MHITFPYLYPQVAPIARGGDAESAWELCWRTEEETQFDPLRWYDYLCVSV